MYKRTHVNSHSFSSFEYKYTKQKMNDEKGLVKSNSQSKLQKQKHLNCYAKQKVKEPINEKMSTSEKIKKFLSTLKDSDLLSWFERYLQKTYTKFNHNIRVKQNNIYPTNVENQDNAICQCQLFSEQYGNYGPVIVYGQNASEALISAIKTLTFDCILQNTKCNYDIVIECLKRNRVHIPKITDNHELKAQKIVEFPPSTPKPCYIPKEQRLQKDNSQSKNILQNQLNDVLKQIEILQKKITKERQINHDLKCKQTKMNYQQSSDSSMVKTRNVLKNVSNNNPKQYLQLREISPNILKIKNSDKNKQFIQETEINCVKLRHRQNTLKENEKQHDKIEKQKFKFKKISSRMATMY